MPTESFELTRERWTLLSQGPCLVENTSTYLRFAVRAAETRPQGWDVDFHIVNPGEDFDHDDSEPLYAVALSRRAKAVVTSDAGQWNEGDALFVSRAVDEGPLTPEVWSLVKDRAVQTSSRIVFDKDTLLASELEIREPVHIVVPLGVSVGFVPTPALVHGALAVDGSTPKEYHTGLFVFRPGGEGSILEIHGKITVGNSDGHSGKGAPAVVNAAAMIGLAFDHDAQPVSNAIRFTGQPTISDANQPCLALGTSCVGYPWDVPGFYSPNEDWDDPDL